MRTSVHELPRRVHLSRLLLMRTGSAIYHGRRKLSLPCRMSGKTKYKTRTDEDVAFLINTAFVSKAYTYNHGDSMRHWDTMTEKLNRTMRLTEAAAIPSWKVKCKFKDTVTKFRGKYGSDKLNHSGSEWTETEF